MEKKEILTNETIDALKNLGTDIKNLPTGKMQIKNLHVLRNENQRQVYITAFYRDPNELPTLKELMVSIGTKFALVKDFVKKELNNLKENLAQMVEPEDDLNYYIDEDGRTYILDENGYRLYDDGLIYGVDPLTNEKIISVCLEDEAGKRFLATYIDKDRNLLVLQNDPKVYHLDEEGYLEVVKNMDYIHHTR